jgi:hypothetical protein
MLPVGVTPKHFPGPTVGDQVVFDDDLELRRYEKKTLGNGLPESQQQRLAGTHSGTVPAKGQVTTRGLFLIDNNFIALQTPIS